MTYNLTAPQHRIGQLLRAGLERRHGGETPEVRELLADYARSQTEANAARPPIPPRPSLAGSGLELFAYLRRYGTRGERQALGRLMARVTTDGLGFAELKRAALELLEPDALPETETAPSAVPAAA